DIKGVSYVFNFDVFWYFDDYVYCIGCIGCVGVKGVVYIFVVVEDVEVIDNI
ncbi:DEAD/DEAH box helicase, partial [Enterococcus hirae]